MKKILLSLILILNCLLMQAQQATVIDPRAITVPRFANAAAVSAAIPTATTGMFIYRNDTQSFWYYNGSGWSNMAAVSAGPGWTADGNNISNSNPGNVGIGTATPTSKLDVNGQLTIDQKNFGGLGGLLIKGKSATENHPNIAFTTHSDYEGTYVAEPVTGLIGGAITNNNYGYETMDLTFQTYNYEGLTEKLRIKSNGNIGVGIQPSHLLHIGNNNFFNQAGLRVEGPSVTGGIGASFGGNGSFLIDKPGVVGGRFSVLENGNVGIGTAEPAVTLDIKRNTSAAAHLRLSGLNESYMEFHPDNTNPATRYGWFGYSQPNIDKLWLYNHRNGPISFVTNGAERLSVTGAGALELSGNAGNLNQILKSNGSVSPPTWTSLSSLITATEGVSTNYTHITGTDPHHLSASTINLFLPTGAKVLIYYKITLSKLCVAGVCMTKALLWHTINGGSKQGIVTAVGHEQAGLISNLDEVVYKYTDNSLGPFIHDLPAGNHVINFYAKNAFDEPGIWFKPSYIILPN